MKTTLERPNPRELACRNRGGIHSTSITMCLPFYRKGMGGLIHRIRKAENHFLKETGEYLHSSFKFWCGNTGFTDSKRHKGATLLSDVPDEGIYCAVCEGKATGAGLNGVRVIGGRKVLFQPRI